MGAIEVLVFGFWAVVILGIGLLVGRFVLIPKDDPDLIDLEEYQYKVLTDMDEGRPVRPVAPIPGGRRWNAEEEKQMEKNRRLAQKIYDDAVVDGG